MGLILVGAHMTRHTNSHNGSFNRATHPRPGVAAPMPVRKLARRWAATLRERRARLGTATLHLVTDSLSAAVPPLPGVVLHSYESADPTDAALTAIDVRWLAYLHVLSRVAPADDDCVFAIDSTDVGIIGNASVLCERHPDAIYVGSDSCDPRKLATSLLEHARSAHLRLSPRVGLFFEDAAKGRLGIRPREHPVYNAGIVGGRWRVWAPFVREVGRRIRAAARRAHGVGGGAHEVDMLVMNEMLLERRAQGGHVHTGWPFGHVNLPMLSSFCDRSTCTRPPLTNDAAAAREHNRKQGECMRRTMLGMAPNYFFVHKTAWLEHPTPLSRAMGWDDALPLERP